MYTIGQFISAICIAFMAGASIFYWLGIYVERRDQKAKRAEARVAFEKSVREDAAPKHLQRTFAAQENKEHARQSTAHMSQARRRNREELRSRERTYGEKEE